MPGESSAQLKQTERDDFGIKSLSEDETKRSGEASEGNLPDSHDPSQDVEQSGRPNASTLSDEQTASTEESL